MSMLVSHLKFRDAERINTLYYNARCFVRYSKELSYCLLGDLHDCSIIDVVEAVVSSSNDNLRKVHGEFSIIVINHVTEAVYIATDKTGKELLYYSERGGLSVSNSFWDLIYYLKFGLQDVSLLALKAQAFLCSDPSYATPVSGVKIYPNAIRATYADKKHSISKYWWFELNENTLSRSEKMDKLTDSIDSTFARLKRESSEDDCFGVGVSGGLDSRIIPYFAQRHELPLVAFMIGQERPNGILMSNDHCRSREIIKHYSLDYTLHEYNEVSFQEQLRAECVRIPIVSSQVFKFPNPKKVNFSRLLTGASGYIVGSSPFYSKSLHPEMEDTLLERQTLLRIIPRHFRYKKGINYLLGNLFNIHEQCPNALNGVLSGADITDLRGLITEAISTMPSKHPIDLMMNYAVGILGQRNKGGAFESLVSGIESHSIYNSQVLELVQEWTVDEILDRRFFEDYIRERLPELAKIRAQDCRASLMNKAPSFFTKCYTLGEYALRGHGVMNYNRWVLRKEYKAFLEASFASDYVSEFFDLNSVKALVMGGQMHASVLNNLVKINMVLQLIDNIQQEYDEIVKEIPKI